MSQFLFLLHVINRFILLGRFYFFHCVRINIRRQFHCTPDALNQTYCTQDY